ncbi:MAG: PEPxxWA-CTERM sorting domain-containing protein [Sandaracinobacteroides sp.]
MQNAFGFIANGVGLGSALMVLAGAGAVQAAIPISGTQTGGTASGIVILPSPVDGAVIGGNNNLTVFEERSGSWSDGTTTFSNVIGVTALLRGATRDGALLNTDTRIQGFLDFGNAGTPYEIVRVITQIPALQTSAAAVGVPGAAFLGPLGISSFLFTALPAGAGLEEVANGDIWSLSNSNSRFNFSFRATTVDSVRLLVRRTPVSPPVSVVPEPASWALLIAGFGLVGGSLRSRRSKALQA